MKYRKFIHTALAAALACGVSSCIEPMFEYEGDCEVVHRVRFRYERNLKWADAFPAEVKSVHLYAFDEAGVFVKDYRGAGEALSQPGYSIRLDLPAGRYRFVAWCGLEDEGATEASFRVPQPEPGVTGIEELTCSLRSLSKGAAESDTQLGFLYHGYLEATLEDPQDGTEYEYTIDLTKDTNHIRIILQELSSDVDMQPGDYSFTIEAANGFMEYDNTPSGNDLITYRPWKQMSDEVGVGKIDVADGSVKYIKGIIADLSVARLMAAQQEELMLTIVNESAADKPVVARVPLIQYALLSRSYYEAAYGHAMDPQEFLDREDEYVMTFFLFNRRWLDAYIDIHQWRIVVHDYDVGS